MENKNPCIYLFGDSFSFIPQESVSEERIWSITLSRLVKFSLYCESMFGCSQDYIFQKIEEHKNQIMSNDQLIIILTDPARFWFFKDRPDLTNSKILDFAEVLNNVEREKAAEYYFKYIQRPELDIQFVIQRLGWLNNLSTIRQWRKPIVILGFPQYTGDINDYPNLILSKGELSLVSDKETIKEAFTYFGIDTRMNHLCFRNHKILAEKLANTIQYNEELNLETGFEEQFFKDSDIYKLEFVTAELDPNCVLKYISNSKKPKTKVQSFWDKIHSKT